MTTVWRVTSPRGASGAATGDESTITSMAAWGRRNLGAEHTTCSGIPQWSTGRRPAEADERRTAGACEATSRPLCFDHMVPPARRAPAAPRRTPDRDLTSAVDGMDHVTRAYQQ